MEEKIKKINTTKINQLISTGNKILKILFILFIILLFYVFTLVIREWNILYIIGRFISIVSPLFIGWFVAWLLNPLVNKLCDRGVKRGLSVVFSYLVLVLVIGVITTFTITSLGKQITDLVTAVPKIAGDISTWIDNFFVKLSNLSLQNLDSTKAAFMLKINTYATNLERNLPEIAVNFMSGLAGGLGKILLSLLLGFYILFDYDKVSKTFISFFPKNTKAEVADLLDRLNTSLYAFISGTLWLSLLLFVVSVIGFSIIGLNAPVLVSFICVVTNLIPYIGPYMGAAVAAAIGFAESPVIGIITLIFIFVVQTIDGNILNPLVMSKKMNLSPITIIISLLIFENLFGIIGMIIATPVVALLKIVYVFLDEKYNFFSFLNKDEE